MDQELFITKQSQICIHLTFSPILLFMLRAFVYSVIVKKYCTHQPICHCCIFTLFPVGKNSCWKGFA